MQIPAILKLFNTLPQLIRDIPVPLVLVPRILHDRRRNRRRRHDTQYITRVNQLYQTLQELRPDLHVLRLELEIMRRCTRRLNEIQSI